MQQPTRRESLQSLLLALACALLVLVAIYLAVENSRAWADRSAPPADAAQGAFHASNFDHIQLILETLT